jgi:hypothetical protein
MRVNELHKRKKQLFETWNGCLWLIFNDLNAGREFPGARFCDNILGGKDGKTKPGGCGCFFQKRKNKAAAKQQIFDANGRTL